MKTNTDRTLLAILVIALTIIGLSSCNKSEQIEPITPAPVEYINIEYQFYIIGELSALKYFEVLKSDGTTESFTYPNACYNIQDSWGVTINPSMTTFINSDCHLDMLILSDGVAIASFSEDVGEGEYNLEL